MAPVMKYLSAAAIVAFLAPTALAGTLEKRMKYHDNEVKFEATNGVPRIPNASFTVTDLSITDGQDPDNVNKCGDVHSFSPGGNSLYFRVGRKGKNKAANWWATNIPNNQNTFNDRPGDLNFAFLGDFYMEVPTADRSSTEGVVLYGIAIGQGHSGASNNWWFGGKNCNHSGDHTVKCKGITKLGGEVYVSFKRGGNDVSTVQVTAVEYP